ncbi:FHA domain-containing protein [Actinomadura rubrisoli]|uniref:FHA domain-containing protein n=1 Tax=Actinomadura rubrisoli TaxID=2530368 RepID=A0A4R5ALU6_9ACTN|nr:FHA domain-containing protein [Actinomadura rubrisoli]
MAPGAQLTFGRGAADLPVDLPLADPGVSRLAGRIRAMDDHWLITNLSRAATYVVENPEGAGEFVKVQPRRLRMPVPFEFSRVVLPAGSGSVSFLVFAPAQLYADPDAPDAGDATAIPFPLDVTAKYFLVLVALCEPRLRDASSVVLPTVPEIIERLAGVPGCAGLTRSAVNFHIDYLAAAKLRVKEPAVDGRAAKADWQRAALVSLALRFNLVRDEHLALLHARG